MRTTTCAATAAILLLGAGCATVSTHRMERGRVDTAGVEITAEDGRYTLRTGETFTPPFSVSCYNLADETPLYADNLVGSYHYALGLGAQRVTVKVSGRDRPLHGVLMLCDVPDSASGPSSRSYLIEVPQSYVDATSGGRISAVYEKVDWRNAQGATMWWYGWVLWLSEDPFR